MAFSLEDTDKKKYNENISQRIYEASVVGVTKVSNVQYIYNCADEGLENNTQGLSPRLSQNRDAASV